jgi:hypothetical protein
MLRRRNSHEVTKNTKESTKYIFFFVIVFVSFVSSWLAVTRAQSTAPAREIGNVTAFARLYGVLRFFYPSDAAADLDWNRFAIDGVARVRTANDSGALALRLRELVAPLGPDIEIGPSLNAFRTPAASTEPLVAWRYFGAGATDLPAGGSAYAAKRTNRVRRTVAAIDGFAGFAQAFPAQNIRGTAIRLRAQVRATARNGTSGAALWLRVDRPQGASAGFFDNMGDRLVRDDSWREYAIEGTVATDAVNIAFGVMTVGAATADFDALELSVRDGVGQWQALPIKDGGFEADGSGREWNRVGSPAAQVTRIAERAPEGRQFVRFAPNEIPPSAIELFADAPPARGEHIDVDLGAGLKARIALTLTDSEAKSSAPPAAAATVATAAVDSRLADVVVAWNFYRHFYPYFAEAAVDWDARLRPQLQRAYVAAERNDEATALRRLVADARDGHGRVMDQRQRQIPEFVPLQFALIESRLVVINSRADAVPVGSVVSSIDGVGATDGFAAAMEVASGTTQWRQSRAADDIGRCAKGATSSVTIDTGKGDPHAVDLTCGTTRPAAVEPRPSKITEVQPGIWYVDLTVARTADLSPSLDKLAAAKGVIFDVRGYPTDAGAWLLPHLIDAPENDRWMHIAKIIGPFGQSAGWQSVGWNLQPIAPKLSGTIVFLTDGRAISYAESVMGYIHDRHLATIVGSATAGTNGNIATFTVPGGFSIVFTGMRVTGHDGSTVHHLVGVKPDVVVTPTIAGLRAGKDEVLERALSLIR